MRQTLVFDSSSAEVRKHLRRIRFNVTYVKVMNCNYITELVALNMSVFIIWYECFFEWVDSDVWSSNHDLLMENCGLQVKQVHLDKWAGITSTSTIDLQTLISLQLVFRPWKQSEKPASDTCWSFLCFFLFLLEVFLIPNCECQFTKRWLNLRK